MTYSVKEMCYTIQGEGFHAGRPAVFVWFSGCNLWNGKEADRKNSVCKFCDTDFVGIDGPGGGKFGTADELAAAVNKTFAGTLAIDRFVVLAGGEPLLQVDDALIDALHAIGFEIAVETNGTIRPPFGIDWLCVSPKEGSELVVRSGDELKVVYPQSGSSNPWVYEKLMFTHFYLQPLDGPDLHSNARLCAIRCMSNPKWHLSLQTHKMIGIR